MENSEGSFEARRVAMMERQFRELQDMNAYHETINASFGEGNVPQTIKVQQDKDKALLNKKFLNETRDLASEHFKIDMDRDSNENISEGRTNKKDKEEKEPGK